MSARNAFPQQGQRSDRTVAVGAGVVPHARPDAPTDVAPGERRGRPAGGHTRLGPSLVPALAMLCVGGFRLGGPALGGDENATWMVARRTLPQIIRLAGNIDGVVTPYYVFMKAWTILFGDSEFALRAPSLISVAAAVGIAGELGRRLISPAAGLSAGLLLVAVPQLSRYAQEARPYGFSLLFATLATLLLYGAVRQPSRRRWCGYALTVTLLGLSHIIGLLVLAGHAVVVGTRSPQRDHRVGRAWLTATAIAVLPVLPLVVLGLSQRGAQVGWIGRLDPGEVLAAPGGVFRSPAAGFLVIGLAMAARGGRVVRQLAALAVLPPALLIGASSLTASSMWVPRYVIFVLTPLCLLAAVTLGGLRWRTGLAVLATAALAAPAHVDLRGPAPHQGPDFRAATAIIAAGQRPGDGIVFGRVGTWSLRAGFGYHTRGRPAPADLLVHRSAAEVGQLNARECPEPATCLAGTSRVWYFGQRRTENPLEDLGTRNGHALRATHRLARVWRLERGTVALFGRR